MIEIGKEWHRNQELPGEMPGYVPPGDHWMIDGNYPFHGF